MASVDALVIGRKTFETVLRLAAWPYGDKRVVVLSTRPVDLSAARGGVVEQMSGAPAEIVSKLGARLPNASMWTEGSRFKGSCGQVSFNVSLSPECLCSLEKEFLSSALYRATCGAVTLRRSILRAAW